MTRRKRISIVVLVLLILLLAIAWIVYMLFSRQVPTDVEVVETPVEETPTTPERTEPTISEVALEQERETRVSAADVVSLSKTFVTRYGSYSNEADFANLSDVLPLMSDAFAAQTQRFIDTSTAPEEYYGVTTRVITVDVQEENDAEGTATVLVTTQREEATGSTQNVEVRYQEILLTFVKEAASWKIDSATWL